MTKRLSVSIVVLLALALSIPAQAATWQVDPVHSAVYFKVSHLVISKVKGQFGEFSGTIDFDGKNFKDASVEFTVQSASIDTDNEKRDEHLKSADFFAVDSFPTFTFVSKSVTEPNDGKFTLTGDLTLRGVTKEVTFDCEFNGTVQDPWGNTRAGFSAETTINRQDFGVDWSQTLDAGGLVVGDEVEIMLEIESVQQQEK